MVTSMTPSHFQDGEVWKIKDQGCTIVLFYADWCPHCVNSVEFFTRVAEMIAFKETYAFNCNAYPEHTGAINKSSKGLINGYPTLILYNNGEPQDPYQGDIKNVNAVVAYAQDMCKKTTKG